MPKIDTNSVQSSMMMPLWGRATYGKENPDILKDPMAQSLMKKLNADLKLDPHAFNE